MASSHVDERVVPQNLEAEKAILGAILLHNNALDAAAVVLKPEHLFRDAHRRIYAAMLSLALRGEPIDIVTLKAELGRKGEIDEVGGPAYISSLMDGIARSSNVTHYAQLVKDAAVLRDVIQAATKMLTDAYAADGVATVVVGDAQHAIHTLAEATVATGFRSTSELLPSLMDKIETLHAKKHNVTGVATGYEVLDSMTLGFQPGELILIAARPSQGKTSLAMNIAEYASEHVGTVGVFSLEMSAESLMIREISSQARVDSHRIRSGFLGERDWGRISHAMGTMGAGRLFIDDSPNLTLFDMRARAKRLQAEHGLSMLMIDYLQLTASETRGGKRGNDNREREVAEMSRGLKGLARELNVPVVVLSQLNRGPENRSDHRPQLSDLRESGALEQDADVVLFLYRDEYYFPDKHENKGIAEVIVGKQRSGPTGVVRLAFIAEYTRFENLAVEAQAATDRQLGEW